MLPDRTSASVSAVRAATVCTRDGARSRAPRLLPAKGLSYDPPPNLDIRGPGRVQPWARRLQQFVVEFDDYDAGVNVDNPDRDRHHCCSIVRRHHRYPADDHRPDRRPPTQLESKDLIVGMGPAAKAGDKLFVQYVGVSYSSKKIFDSSWSLNQPYPLTLGNGTVIAGWDKGIVGMQVGGRRELIIPASLAYGSRAAGSGIAANDTLIFIVDLVKIN